MNRSGLFVIIILIFTSINCMVLSFLFTNIAHADHVAPEVQTQINKRSDLFERSIDDLPNFTKQIEDGKQTGIDSMGGEGGNPQGLQYLTKKNKGELQQESSKLEGLSEHELNGRGMEEIIKNDTIDELYTDYSRPLNKQHIKDAKTISKSQDELLGNLLGKLKELGVDCKTIKGDKKHEPEYFLQTKKTPVKDTVYNQTFCEELRNKYSCNDELRMRCKRKGMKWHPWQLQTMQMVYNTMPGYWWFRGLVMDKNSNITNYGDYGWSQSINFSYRQEITQEIAKRLGVSSEQINLVPQETYLYPDKLREHQSRNVDFSNCECWYRWGVAHYLVDNAIITFHYQYRDATQICEEWQEEWHERCRLQ